MQDALYLLNVPEDHVQKGEDQCMELRLDTDEEIKTEIQNAVGGGE